jgi:hypothetical protein
MKDRILIVIGAAAVLAIAGLMLVVSQNGLALRSLSSALSYKEKGVASAPVPATINNDALGKELSDLRADFKNHIEWENLTDPNSVNGYFYYWQKVFLSDKNTGKKISFSIPKISSELTTESGSYQFGVLDFPKDTQVLGAYSVSPVARSGTVALAVFPSNAENDAAYLCSKANPKNSNARVVSFETVRINGREYCERTSGDCGAGSCGEQYDYTIKLGGYLLDLSAATYGSTCQAYDNPDDCAPFIGGILNNIAQTLKIE